MTEANSPVSILVVDDEPNVLSTIQAILQHEGYVVDACGDGAAALRAIRERHYDLVLTDLKMPGVDGLAVLAEVRRQAPETVTVMMTGYGSIDSALEAIQLGAYEYLLKPTEVPELQQVVRRSLERKRFSEIEVLYRVSRTLPSLLDPQEIADRTAEAARQVLGLEHASLLWCERGQRISASHEAAKAMLEDPALEERLAAAEIITAENAGAHLRDVATSAGLRAFVLVPGLGKERLVCVLFAHQGRHAHDFHAHAQRFLRSLVTQAAMALENALLLAELKTNNEELAAANRKLAELDALKSQFLSVATHELRTPLTLLLGYNSMLAESLGDRLSTEEQQTLSESVAACKRLIRLVNSMLDLSQIQSGKMRMEFVETDLRALISSVVTLFQHEARQKKISLSATLPARLPALVADPERLQQVLINLLNNALKFTPEGGAVRVQARQPARGEAVEIRVIDTGIGIAAEDQQKIFDEFIQLKQHVDGRHKQGAGLGLAIVRRVVEAHNGDIEVCSAVGKGSTFTIRLPVIPLPATVAVSA